MKIPLRDLPQGHSAIDRAEPAEPLDLGDWLAPRGPVRVQLDADRRDQQVTLRGAVELEAEHTCARCLKAFPAVLGAPLLVLADRRGSDDLDDEVVLEQEGSVLYHDGIEIELDPPIREAIILEVPLVVVCKPDCAGLCPECGQDRNEAACTCAPPQGDPRWDALRTLKEKNPKRDSRR
jgi:uncharacterized protein